MAHVVQALVDDENGVVHHGADENDEAQHGQHVQGLILNQVAHQPQTSKTPSSRQRHTEHDNERIEKAGEKGRQKQVGDDQG